MKVTYDELAVDLLLSGEQPDSARFRALAAHGARAIECPECGCTDHCENGSETLCCTGCGTHHEIPELEL